MWSNSSRRRISQHRSANIKGYLGVGDADADADSDSDSNAYADENRNPNQRRTKHDGKGAGAGASNSNSNSNSNSKGPPVATVVLVETLPEAPNPLSAEAAVVSPLKGSESASVTSVGSLDSESDPLQPEPLQRWQPKPPRSIKAQLQLQVPVRVPVTGPVPVQSREESPTAAPSGSSSTGSTIRSGGGGIRDDSAAVAEFGNELMDLDNYMLSVYHMNDDAGSTVFARGVGAGIVVGPEKNSSSQSSQSSQSSSPGSTATGRHRHRGAFRNRRKGSSETDNNDGNNDGNNGNGNGNSSNEFDFCPVWDESDRENRDRQREQLQRELQPGTWWESIRKSSGAIFADGENEWTPGTGFRSVKHKKHKGWDADPGEDWKDRDPFFDDCFFPVLVERERLEI